jgi:hypothetical protein
MVSLIGYLGCADVSCPEKNVIDPPRQMNPACEEVANKG